MNTKTQNLSIRILFGAITLLMTMNAVTSVYYALFQNMNSPWADQSSLVQRDSIVDAFTFQIAGYRLAMSVTAVYAFFSNKHSQIFLFCLGVIVINLWQVLAALFTSTYSEQFPFIVALALMAGYCLWLTRKE